MWVVSWLEHVVFLLVLLVLGSVAARHGIQGVLAVILKTLKLVPGFESLLQTILSGEVKSFTRQVKRGTGDAGAPARLPIPEKGIPQEELLKEMEEIKAGDIDPESGKMFAYVYTADGDTFETQRKAFDMFTEKTGLGAEHDKLVQTFHHAFMHENALNPMVFPSLRRFENEVISMAAWMMNGDERVAGSLTSGGTESILMAMKAYRDRAKKLFPFITKPNMVAPITIHPAHEKAAHYFGFEIIHVPFGPDFTPDVREMEKAITPNTIALLCSAPPYPHGVMDPIEELSEVAVRRGLPLHVDSCFGGFMLPWVEKLGYNMPKFDFRLPGVTSITADIHKYGFGAKGASVVLYRDVELRKYQLYAYSMWPGGLFGSPSMAGTRPGGNIAAAWVALRAMGQDGYMKMAQTLMDTTNKLKDAINGIEGVCILGKPHMTSFAIGADDGSVDILALADAMEEEGWKIERQQYPASLHCTIMPHHVRVADELIACVKSAADKVRNNKDYGKKGTAAMYGMVANIPDKSIIDDFIVEFFSEVYTP